jgi:hypothetical protein
MKIAKFTKKIKMKIKVGLIPNLDHETRKTRIRT